MASKLFYWFVFVSLSSVNALENVCNLDSFRTNGIVPNKIPTVPESIMKVEYKDATVNCGNLLSRSKTQETPTFVDYEADKNKLYTLVMFDPDVFTPQNPEAANYRHWLVENIPGNDVKNGDEISPYYPTDPPSYSDAHRYIFLVYEQTDGQRLVDKFPNESDKRLRFDHNRFLGERNLKGPVAGNFFYCHH